MMMARNAGTIVDGYSALGISPANVPIVVVAAGQSNMVGAKLANNGPLYAIDDVFIWDRGSREFRAVDLSVNTYAVHNAKVGGGRNNLAVGFAARLQKEFPGRRIYIIFNCTNGRRSQFWTENGVNSEDWVELIRDINDTLLPIIGARTIDFFLWQQGENDVDAGAREGAYSHGLQVLRNQARSESWWSDDTVLICGEPCRGWSDTSSLDFLISELEAFAALKYEDAVVAKSLSGVGGDYNILPFARSTDSIHFSGRALYSLGYYAYWDALPVRFPKRAFKDLWKDQNLPWNDVGRANYPSGSVKYSRSGHLARAPLYTLAPSIAKVGDRLFVGATINSNFPGETGGTHARIVWSDDDGATWNGDSTGGTGIGFVRENGGVMEPCLWAAPDGKLWIFMVSVAGTRVSDGRHGVHLAVIDDPLFSHSDIPRISDPISVVPFGWCQKPVYVNGKWYLAVSYWQSLTNGNEGLANFVPYLQGRHYFEIDLEKKQLEWAFHLADIDPGHQFDESSVTQLGDGALLGSWRTVDGPRFSKSIDNGGSWSAAVPSMAVGTEASATAASSRHKTIAAHEGAVLFAWNKAADRTKLTVALSDTPSSVSNFDPINKRSSVIVEGSASYPDMTIAGDTCYLVCDDGFGPERSRSKTRQIRTFKFSVSSLRDNAVGMVAFEKSPAISGK